MNGETISGDHARQSVNRIMRSQMANAQWRRSQPLVMRIQLERMGGNLHPWRNLESPDKEQTQTRPLE